jgi:predicted CopG family antitoxin
MTTIHLINLCRESDFQKKYGSQVYYDISKAKKESNCFDDVIRSLQQEHDDFVGFSGEEHTKQRKQDIQNAIQFLNDYKENVNLANMTVQFVEY